MAPSLRCAADASGRSITWADRSDCDAEHRLPEAARRTDVNTEMLREAPLFSGLDDEAAEALSASMNETKVRRGDVLFHEGDEGDRLYVVTDGKVKLGRTSADGR
jgi:hypothetical protein